MSHLKKHVILVEHMAFVCMSSNCSETSGWLAYCWCYIFCILLSMLFEFYGGPQDIILTTIIRIHLYDIYLWIVLVLWGKIQDGETPCNGASNEFHLENSQLCLMVPYEVCTIFFFLICNSIYNSVVFFSFYINHYQFKYFWMWHWVQ